MTCNRADRRHLASLHAEIALLNKILKNIGYVKFCKNISKIHVISLAFKYDTDSDTWILVNARPCASCIRVFSHFNPSGWMSYSDDFSNIITDSIANLSNIATPSFCDKYSQWLVDKKIIYNAKNSNNFITMNINRKDTLNNINDGSKTIEVRCVWPNNASKSISKIKKGYVINFSSNTFALVTKVHKIKKTTISNALKKIDWSNTMPDAANISDVAHRLTDGCYSKNISRFGSVCTVYFIYFRILLTNLS